MFERFTDRARRAVVLAEEEAHLLLHNYVGTEHLLLGLIHEGDGVAASALRELDVSLEAVRERVEEIIARGGGPATQARIPFTPRAKKVLELSLREALQLGHNYIGTEHLLLGLIREGEGVAAQILVQMGAGLDPVRAKVLELLGSPHGGQPGSGTASPSTTEAPSTPGVDTAYLLRVLRAACREARQLGHRFVGTEHVLFATLALLTPEAKAVTDLFGVTADDARATPRTHRSSEDDPGGAHRWRRRRDAVPVGSTGHDGSGFRVYAPLTPTAFAVATDAEAQAQQRSQLSVRPEHILLAVMNSPDSVGCQILRSLVFDYDVLRLSLEARLQSARARRQSAPTPADAVDESEVRLPDAKVLAESLNRIVVGQERAVAAVVTAAVLHSTAVETGITNQKPNILLRGPTGVGKTFTIRQLARQLRLPFATANCAAITAPGYVGGDFESVFWDLYLRANRNVDLAERGVIFLDEIDKLGTGPENRRRETRLSIPVQQVLNRIIEGDTVTACETGAIRTVSDDQVTLRTERIWFIGAGAFSGLEDVPSRKSRPSPLFGTRHKQLFDDSDLIEYGLMPELIGRFRLMIELEPLSISSLVRILSAEEESPTALYRAYFKERGVDLELTEEAQTAIAEYAAQRQLGARPLSGLLHAVLEHYVMQPPEEGQTLSVSAEDVRRRLTRMTNGHITSSEPGEATRTSLDSP